MYKRAIPLSQMTKKANYFLFGPRATGKSYLIKHTLKKAEVIDLLEDRIYEQLVNRPESLIELIANKKSLIVIDEIQKIPKLINEVHRLIEKYKMTFLLTGSSARKLRRQGINMLGGRAREAQLFPLTFLELDKKFNLLKYLNVGGLPLVYSSKSPYEDLQAYCKTYLHEEIKMEAAVKNYDRFVRFLETMALTNGQEINYEKLSSDCGVPARTLEIHIEILKDTLLAFELPPFTKTIKRKAVTRSKFYLFDPGVANFIARRLHLTEGHSDLGISFEHFIINELRAYISYSRKFNQLSYWRSRETEVDVIVDNSIGIEIKLSKKFRPEFAQGLLKMNEEVSFEKMFIVGNFTVEGIYENIRYVNYQQFLKLLWTHKIF